MTKTNLISFGEGGWRPPRADSTGFQRELPDPDDYVLAIGAIWPIGIQKTWDGTPKDQICVVFELDQADSKGHPFVVHQPLTRSMYEEAPFYKLVCAAFPGEMHDKLSVEDMIGKCVYGTVYHTKKGDKARVKDFKKLPRKESPFPLIGDYSQPDRLVLWMQKNAMTPEDAALLVESMPKTKKPMTDEEFNQHAKDFAAPKPGEDDVPF